MNFRAKETIVYGGLLLFTLWPLVHIGLVATYDLSPWKLGGWGMYSAPRDKYQGMEIYGENAKTGRREQLTRPSAQTQTAAGEFLERYRWLRQLADPGPLVAAVREDRPDWRALRIQVYRTDLDPETSKIVMREHVYEYRD